MDLCELVAYKSCNYYYYYERQHHCRVACNGHRKKITNMFYQGSVSEDEVNQLINKNNSKYVDC